MQTAKAASTVARIAERIIALWHSKVFTFWSDRFEKRLIDESIENKVLMRLCCNGVVRLRLTRRGRAGVRKIPQKSPKSPLPLIALHKVDVIVAVTLAAPACDQHNPRLFSSCVAFGGKADMVRSGAVILKISLRTCEGGLRFAEQTNFGPYPLEPEVAGNSWRAQSQQRPIRRQLALIRALVRVPIAFNPPTISMK
jgi:hypothetical protein